MSRFDLFFVVVDEPDHERDDRIATHILDVHCGIAAPAGDDRFTRNELLQYVSAAHRLEPRISTEAREELVRQFVELRQEDAGGVSRNSYRITVRQLEALIRIGEALAKMHMDEVVRPAYAQEAARLLRSSIIQVEGPPVDLGVVPEEQQVGAELEAEQPRPAACAIAYEQYRAIALAVVDHLQQGGVQGVQETLEDLCGWWADLNKDEYTELQGIEDDLAIFRKTVRRLAARDEVLIIDAQTGVVSVHPNYDPV